MFSALLFHPCGDVTGTLKLTKLSAINFFEPRILKEDPIRNPVSTIASPAKIVKGMKRTSPFISFKLLGIGEGLI